MLGPKPTNGFGGTERRMFWWNQHQDVAGFAGNSPPTSMQKLGRLPKGIGLHGVITGYSRDIYIYPITPVSHYTSIICWL